MGLGEMGQNRLRLRLSDIALLDKSSQSYTARVR